jgi:hypothetical protein
MEVALNPAAPPDPEYLLEALEVFAKCARVANGQTRAAGALTRIGEADAAIGYLIVAAGELPQFIGRLAEYLRAQHEQDRIRTTQGRAGARVTAAGIALDQAAGIARALESALKRAGDETRCMYTPGDSG